MVNREGKPMSLRFHWFLPTNGDGRNIVGGGHGVATSAAGAIRPASLAYLSQIARRAEQLGFEAALTPTGARCRTGSGWPARSAPYSP
jgi:alkanesulfonate monooxygenase